MTKARYNGQGKVNFGQGKVSENQGISFQTKGGHPGLSLEYQTF